MGGGVERGGEGGEGPEQQAIHPLPAGQSMRNRSRQDERRRLMRAKFSVALPERSGGCGGGVTA
jgi:hypothetical protein